MTHIDIRTSPEMFVATQILMTGGLLWCVYRIRELRQQIDLPGQVEGSDMGIMLAIALVFAVGVVIAASDVLVWYCWLR